MDNVAADVRFIIPDCPLQIVFFSSGNAFSL
jgi:hypothetical protein